MKMKKLQDIKYKDADVMLVRRLRKQTLQTMLTQFRKANKKQKETIFHIEKVSMGYNVFVENSKGNFIRIFNALNFKRFYIVRIERNLVEHLSSPLNGLCVKHIKGQDPELYYHPKAPHFLWNL
tara:strand:+ start:195 stop:566 length:372 start_codon:yes stop_codon:yes gene_type:complete